MANTKRKKAAKKVALKDTLAKITKTAKVVNEKVTNTATEVLEDVSKNGKYWSEEAVQSAKEFDVNNGLNKFKKAAKNANAYSLEVADGLVEAALENGKDWQVVASKAVKGGLKLADKQQDIFFDTLEAMKDQFAKSAKRFQKLVREE